MFSRDTKCCGALCDVTNKTSSSQKLNRWSPSTPSTKKYEIRDNNSMAITANASVAKFAIDVERLPRGGEAVATQPSARSLHLSLHHPDVDYPSTLEQACQMIDQQREDIVKTLEVGQELLCRLADVQNEFEQLTEQFQAASHDKHMLEQENWILKNRLVNSTEARGQAILLQEQLQEKEFLLEKEQLDRLQKSHQDRLDRERQEMSCLNSICQSPSHADFASGDRLSLLEQKYLAQLKENSCLREQLQGLSDLQDLLHEKEEWIQTLQGRLASRAPLEPGRTGPNDAAEEEVVSNYLTSPASCISLAYTTEMISTCHKSRARQDSPSFSVTGSVGSSLLRCTSSQRAQASSAVLQRLSQRIMEVKHFYFPSRILDFADEEGEKPPNPTSVCEGTSEKAAAEDPLWSIHVTPAVVEKAKVKLADPMEEPAPSAGLRGCELMSPTHWQEAKSSLALFANLESTESREADAETLTSHSVDWEMASESTMEATYEDAAGKLSPQLNDKTHLGVHSPAALQLQEVELTMGTDFSGDAELAQYGGQSCAGPRLSDAQWEALEMDAGGGALELAIEANVPLNCGQGPSSVVLPTTMAEKDICGTPGPRDPVSCSPPRCKVAVPMLVDSTYQVQQLRRSIDALNAENNQLLKDLKHAETCNSALEKQLLGMHLERDDAECRRFTFNLKASGSMRAVLQEMESLRKLLDRPDARTHSSQVFGLVLFLFPSLFILAIAVLASDSAINISPFC
eukprot:GGOE01019101.1.p1 GENE.GGOE01019101.1~~GGOE01019101.1.p1  ORF type:complete len:773 (+),score=132.47 GGOE01019101.1:93-2321(+)